MGAKEDLYHGLVELIKSESETHTNIHGVPCLQIQGKINRVPSEEPVYIDLTAIIFNEPLTTSKKTLDGGYVHVYVKGPKHDLGGEKYVEQAFIAFDPQNLEAYMIEGGNKPVLKPIHNADAVTLIAAMEKKDLKSIDQVLIRQDTTMYGP